MKNHSFGAAVVAVLLIAPVLTSADQNEPERAPYQQHIDPKTIPYVDEISIAVRPELEPAFGEPLPAGLVQVISELAGVSMSYVRNAGESHIFRLPNKVYEAEAEALCKKVRQDNRIKWCSPDAMGFGQTAIAPNDPKFVSGEQWNLGNDAPAGINAKAAWSMTPGLSSTVIAVIDGGIIPHTEIADTRLVPGYDFISDVNMSVDGNGWDDFTYRSGRRKYPRWLPL